MMAACAGFVFCTCGRDVPAIAGLCRRCYWSAANSRRRFAGLREQILERDGYVCRGCGGAGRLHVHHRAPGINDRDLLISVCGRCHARLHRLAAVRVWIPDALLVLWAEQHSRAPVQLQFPLAVDE